MCVSPRPVRIRQQSVAFIDNGSMNTGVHLSLGYMGADSAPHHVT